MDILGSMPFDPQILFPLLLVGSIAGAGLTLSGGNFLTSCISVRMKIFLQEPLGNIISIEYLLLPLMKLILMTIILFLISELVLIGYIIVGSELFVYISYISFMTANLMLLYLCLSYGLWYL